MATVGQLIQSSMRLIGHLEPGFTPSTDHTNVGVDALNRLIAMWTAKGTMVYQISRDTLALTGAATYMWGVGQPLTSTKPTRIKSVQYKPTSNIAMPVEIVTADKWDAVVDTTATGYPDMLFYDYAEVIGTMYLSPIPPTGGSLLLSSYKALGATFDASTVLYQPVGYEHALRYNLAVLLAPEFRRELPQYVMDEAIKSEAALAALNAEILGPMIGGAK